MTPTEKLAREIFAVAWEIGVKEVKDRRIAPWEQSTPRTKAPFFAIARWLIRTKGVKP